MQMIFNSSAGGAAEIHTQVEAIGMVDIIDGRLHALQEQHHFGCRISFESGKIRGVRVRYDHHVS